MRRATIAIFILGICCTASAQQTIVLPAISDNVHGVNGSIWATEVQIIKMDPDDHPTIRRLWVCVEGGGFADDPATAPTWEMERPERYARILRLSGADLLVGTGASLGAVALEIEGGEVIVNARVADVSRGTMWGETPFGQGQLMPTDGEPLIGPSHLPWLGGCLNTPCNVVPRENWTYYRNNIGIVNSNPEPLVLEGVALAFGEFPGVVESSLELMPPGFPTFGERDTFTKILPPYGWVQFRWQSEKVYIDPGAAWNEPDFPSAGFLMSLSPDADLPYYAYASVVFAPDPELEIPAFNDPLFIPARPGFVAPFDWEQDAP